MAKLIDEALGNARVLHVAEVLKGGTASYIEEVVCFQRRQLGDNHLVLLIPKSQQSYLTGSIGLATHTFEDKPGRLSNAWQLLRKVKTVADENAVSIIHIHGTFAGIACRIAFAGMRNRPRLIYCAHGWAFDREGRLINRAIGLVERFLSHFCDKIICISQHDMDSAKRVGIPAKKLVLIHNGIADETDPQASITWPDGADKKTRVLFAGRFDRQKGIDIFLDAMAILGDRFVACAIGDITDGNVSISDIPPNVELKGWLSRAEVQSYLRSSHVFVMPSRWEGFGLSALEAMRAGVAVIASRVGGLPELVIDNVTGRLVDPENADMLADVLISLDIGTLVRMGREARNRYMHYFDAELMNRKILKLYTLVTIGPKESTS